MEAALAWCHVQHSQKQVPVVPKEDVKRLVEYQLQSGRPIRAPWYRPQKDDEEGSDGAEEPQVPEPVEPEPAVETPPQMRSSTPAQGVPKPRTPHIVVERLEQGSSPPRQAGKPPRSPTPLRMGAPHTPVRKSPSPPARMSPTPPFPSGSMVLPPVSQKSALPPIHRSVTPPLHVNGKQNLAKQTSPGVSGTSTPMLRPANRPRHGTGFFVPPGLVV